MLKYLRRIIMIPFITIGVMICTLWLFFRLAQNQGLDSEQVSIGGEWEKQQILDQYWIAQEQATNQNLPLFYFSILPTSVPTQIFDLPLGFRSSLVDLCKEVRNPAVMTEYFHWINSQYRDFRQSGIASDYTADMFIELLSVSSIDQWRECIKDNRLAQDFNGTTLLNVSPSVRSWTYRIKWLGNDNLFHQFWENLLRDHTIYKVFYQSVQWTLAYTIPGIILSYLIAMTIVIIGHFSLKSDRFLRFFRQLSLIFYSLPTFVVGLLGLIFLTSHRFGWISYLFPFPAFYERSIHHLGEIYWYYGGQLILPMILFSIWPGIVFFRLFDEKIKRYLEDWEIHAYLEHWGMTKRKLYWKYIPSFLWVTSLATFSNILVGLFGGSLVLEVIFNIPGLGRVLYDAILAQNVDLTVFLILVFTIIFQLGHLIVDMAIAFWLGGKEQTVGL